MKIYRILEDAIAEAKYFLLECGAYKNRLNVKYKFNDSVYYDEASTERGILKAISPLLIRKLQSWRKSATKVDTL